MNILLVRSRKRTDFNPVPHLGLGLLSAVLELNGHDVTVVDQLLFLGRGKHQPSIKRMMKEIKPDVIGFSIYTATYYESLKLIESVRPYGCPIMVGGPHPTLFCDEMSDLRCFDYIVKGEAEEIMPDLVENARTRPRPVIIEGKSADVNNLPLPDFTAFVNWRSITQYPLSTSRGCPFGCSFCSVKDVSSRRWRGRDVDECIDELLEAKKTYPLLRSVKIVDDCPTYDIERFKHFLREYSSRGIDLDMSIDNIRADSIDQEMVALARRARNSMICVGAEHGNEEVFNAIGKGEKLEDVSRAAELIKSGGLDLGACFIIGLPFDNLERTRDSIEFAKKMKADLIYWNMAHPMNGTKIMDWYRRNNARINDLKGYTSYDRHTLRTKNPVVETEDFTRSERKKAYFIAVVETGQYPARFSELFRLIVYSIRYRYVRGLKRALPELSRRILKGYDDTYSNPASGTWRS